MGAPVCNVNQTGKPVQVGGPALPAIPKATDLASAIKAINAIAQTVNIIVNNGVPSNPGGVNPGGGFTSNPAQNANFNEIRAQRISQTQRIYNPQDKTQYVDVNQITGLTFLDPQTKQTLIWKQ